MESISVFNLLSNNVKVELICFCQSVATALRHAPPTNSLVWMEKSVFPRILCVIFTQTVMTTQMSWHHSAMIAHPMSFSSVRKMAKRFAVQLHLNVMTLWTVMIFADELVSECGSCPSDTRFICKKGGKEVCLSKEGNQCDGKFSCDDASDEAPSVCANCRHHPSKAAFQLQLPSSHQGRLDRLHQCIK